MLNVANKSQSHALVLFIFNWLVTERQTERYKCLHKNTGRVESIVRGFYTVNSDNTAPHQHPSHS